MIRLVLDTNIIVSALPQPTGPPARIFILVLGGLQLCLSAAIYAEYEEVLSCPRLQHSQETIASTLQAIREQGFWLRPAQRIRTCADPDDDVFLECAQAAQADYLVTGNTRHFPTSWVNTRIVTARWLLDSLSADKS
jgi:putative PIN family toxin of toxin-antitoxin system